MGASLTGIRNGSDDRAAAVPCAIWGVLNVTPDSFSDGGRFCDADAAVAHATRMLREGADVIDVGGESSRPSGKVYGAGAEAVSVEEELGRVLPVVERLVRHGATVSVDTVKPEVADRVLEQGAAIINDVSMGRSEHLLRVVAEREADLVLMHNRRRGEVDAENTDYGDVVAEVVAELMAAADRAISFGVRKDRIWLDPGVGFAKTAEQSLELIANVDRLISTGHRILLGPSRKSFIAGVAPNANDSAPSVAEREGGTAASVAFAAFCGVHAVRVHNVIMMRQASRVAEALRRSSRRSGA